MFRSSELVLDPMQAMEGGTLGLGKSESFITKIFGGGMKKLAWILVFPLLICTLGRAQSSPSANSSQDAGSGDKNVLPARHVLGMGAI